MSWACPPLMTHIPHPVISRDELACLSRDKGGQLQKPVSVKQQEIRETDSSFGVNAKIQ